MAIKDLKITNNEVNANHVGSAKNLLDGSPSDNKAVFDKYPNLIKTRLNSLIDLLDTIGADNAVISPDGRIKFIKLSTDGTLLTSTDGTSWTETTSGHDIVSGSVVLPRRKYLKFDNNVTVDDDGETITVHTIKGEKGDKGDKGDEGTPVTSVENKPVPNSLIHYAMFYAGDHWIGSIPIIDGDRGPKGDKGDKGDRGDVGETGAPFTYDMFTPQQLEALTGPQGPQGNQGIQGIQGPTGPQGPKGDSVVGPQGPKGEDGDAGFSPIITTSKSGKTTTVTVTDATGTHTFTILDGADGEGSGDMSTGTYDKNLNGIVDNAEKVNGHTVDKDVPSNAKFTDTVYDDTALAGRVSAIEGKESGWDAKMEYYIITFDGTAFKYGTKTLTFSEIKTLCLDEKHFVYAQYSSRLYIPQYVSSNNIFFQSTYISSDVPQIHRISINNLNQVSQYNYNLAKDTDIPTNISAFTNDANYAKKSELPDVPTNLSDLTDDLGSSPIHTHSQYLTAETDPSIFWATYGTTTYAEISAAVSAGKVVLCWYNSRLYVYGGLSTYHYFICKLTTTTVYYVRVSSSNAWNNSSATMQTTSNLIKSTASTTESDTNYYSALKTKNAIKAVADTVPTASISGNTITINGTSITVPVDGSEVSY